MLFHSLSGPEVHGVIDEMDRRAKSEAPAISSAIDRGDTETVGASGCGVGTENWDLAGSASASSPRTLGRVLRDARDRCRGSLDRVRGPGSQAQRKPGYWS